MKNLAVKITSTLFFVDFIAIFVFMMLNWWNAVKIAVLVIAVPFVLILIYEIFKSIWSDEESVGGF